MTKTHEIERYKCPIIIYLELALLPGYHTSFLILPTTLYDRNPSSLNAYMTQIDSDIEKFNENVRNLLD